MIDKLGFLDGQAPAEGEVEGEVATEAAQAQAGRQRDEHGRFAAQAPTEPAAPETPATAAPEPTASPPEPGHVPISALLDEREKRQKEAAQREALERQLEQLRAQAHPPRELEPTEALQAALYQQNLRASRRFAEREYGKETVAAVHDWARRRCDEDPHFNQQMRSSEDPYEAAYQAYNREQIVSKVTPDRLAAFEAWEAAQAAAQGQTQAPSHQAPASRAPPPRSLATASGSGAAGAPHVPVGPGQAFASVLNR